MQTLLSVLCNWTTQPPPASGGFHHFVPTALRMMKSRIDSIVMRVARPTLIYCSSLAAKSAYPVVLLTFNRRQAVLGGTTNGSMDVFELQIVITKLHG